MKDAAPTTAKHHCCKTHGATAHRYCGQPGPTRYSAAVERAEERRCATGFCEAKDKHTAACLFFDMCGNPRKRSSAEEAEQELREALVCSDECDEHHVYGPDCVANVDPNHWSAWQSGGWVMPSVTVRRGGLRFWPMLPDPHVRISEYGWWLWKRYHVHAYTPPPAPNYASEGVPLGIFKTMWKAKMCKEGVEQYQRAVYAEIKKRVGDQW